ENRLLWVYQNIIGKNIIKSVKKADRVIVQSEWMKRACIEKIEVKSEKIEVIPPQINTHITKYFQPSKDSFRTFFYPANGLNYKNHRIIVDACLELRKQNIENYEVI